jgi:hypothetical protein
MIETPGMVASSMAIDSDVLLPAFAALVAAGHF